MSSAKNNITRFFTRESANTGIDIALPDPSGKDSGHSIKIRGMDSDQFRLETSMSKQRIGEKQLQWKLDNHNPSVAEKAKIVDIERINVLSTLVISWTLEDPCTPENIKVLLTEAPSIANLIDTAAGDRNRFFYQGSTNSMSESEPKES